MHKTYYVFKCGCRVEFSKLAKIPVPFSLAAKFYESGMCDINRQKHFCHTHGEFLDYRIRTCKVCGCIIKKIKTKGTVPGTCDECKHEASKKAMRARYHKKKNLVTKPKKRKRPVIKRGDYCKSDPKKCARRGRTDLQQNGCLYCDFFQPVYGKHDPVLLARTMGLLPKLKKKRSNENGKHF